MVRQAAGCPIAKFLKNWTPSNERLGYEEDSVPVTTDSTAPDKLGLERLLAEAAQFRGVSLWQDAWRRLRRKRVAMVSLVFLVAVSLAALLTPVLPLQSPIDQDLKQRQLLPPNLTPYRLDLGPAAANPADAGQSKLWHNPGWMTRKLIGLRLRWFGGWSVPSICGTDNLGRDVLARLFWGARVSLIVGVVATLVSLVIGVSYGATAGYLGGWIDSLLMRFVDVLYSIPFIFIVIFLITILSQEQIKLQLARYHINQIVVFYVIIGAIYWLTMARVVRGQVLSLKNEQFVDAARTSGAGSARIIFVHLVPNVLSVVIVYLTLTIPAVMLFEAFLSFLGLGVTPPDVSWGLLVNEGLQVITPVRIHWWLVVFPGLALTLTLFALNFLGDGIRDALDPRMKNR